MEKVRQKQLSNNFLLIFEVLDIYLTLAGYGRLDVAGVFEFLAGIGRGV